MAVAASTEDSEKEGEEDAKGSEIELELEPWADFLKRTAQWTEEQLEKANLCQWTAQWRRRQWHWASKLMDKANNKWSAVATKWEPLIHSSCPSGRLQARPKKRWEQDFRDYLRVALPDEKRHWHELAADTKWWDSQCESFVLFFLD